jgi:hypothetical protein
MSYLMRTFSEFSEQIILVTLVGLVGIQTCLLLRLYVLAGMVAMALVLLGMAVMIGYYFHRE